MLPLETRTKLANLLSQALLLVEDIRREEVKAFCPTGSGGGIDNSCSPNGGGSEQPVAKLGQDGIADVPDNATASSVLDTVRVGYEARLGDITCEVIGVKKQTRSDPIFHPTDPSRVETGTRKTLVVTVKGINQNGQRLSKTYREVISEEVPWDKAFCPTGPGGGIDNSCGRDGGDSASGSRVLFEAPDPNDTKLSGRWNSLPARDRTEISDTIAKKILPEVFKAVGVKAELHQQYGGYLDDTNPSFAAVLSKGTDVKDVMDVTKLAGFALSQDSMMVVSDKEFSGADKVGLITVKLPKEMTLGDVHGVYKQLRTIDDGVIQGHTTVDGQMMIVDFSGDSAGLAKKINSQLDDQYSVHVDAGFVAFPHKGEYNYASDSGGSAGLAARGEDARRFREEAAGLIDAELTKRGKAVAGGGPSAEELILKFFAGDLTEDDVKAFCPTGPGGGVDNSCSPGGGGDAGLSNDKLLGDRTPSGNTRNSVSTREDLYAMAPEVKTSFDKAMDSGEGVDKAIGGVAARVDSQQAFLEALMVEEPVVIMAPLKGAARAEEKVNGKYGGDWSKLGDVVRGTVAVNSKDDIPSTITAIMDEMEENGFKLAEFDNRMASPLPSGYRDLNTKWTSSSGMVVELQINTKAMVLAKEKEGHKLYEQERSIVARAAGRDFTKEEQAEISALQQAGRRIYDEAWGAK